MEGLVAILVIIIILALVVKLALVSFIDDRIVMEGGRGLDVGAAESNTVFIVVARALVSGTGQVVSASLLFHLLLSSGRCEG